MSSERRCFAAFVSICLRVLLWQNIVPKLDEYSTVRGFAFDGWIKWHSFSLTPCCVRGAPPTLFAFAIIWEPLTGGLMSGRKSEDRRPVGWCPPL